MANAINHSTKSLCLRAEDGVELGAKLYEPVKMARATVLGLPGIGVPQRVFRHVAGHLADRGVRVLTLDYRGIGASRSPVATRTATLSRWAKFDATSGLRYLEERGFEKPVLLGHSFGGQILGLNTAMQRLGGAILVASQMGHPKHWQGLDRLKIELFWRALVPLCLSVQPSLPRWVIGETLPGGVAREWQRWATSDDWFCSHDADAEGRFADFPAPVLAYAIADDFIAPRAAVDDILRRFQNAPVQCVDVTPSDLQRSRVGHAGLFRGENLEHLWESWVDFAVEHGAPDAPSQKRRSGVAA